MSREIKFRAFDKDTKCYFYDVAVYPDNVVGIQRHNIESEILKAEYGATHWTELGENAIIEQYTGLKDKNGKEIYEGDIVEEDIDLNSKMTDGTFRYKVYWNENELCWSLDPISLESIHNDLWELNSSCRVIGNVHEPPKDFRPEHLKRMGISISKGNEE